MMEMSRSEVRPMAQNPRRSAPSARQIVRDAMAGKADYRLVVGPTSPLPRYGRPMSPETRRGFEKLLAELDARSVLNRPASRSSREAADHSA